MENRILIVDDEPEVLDILEKILTDEGYDVTKASTGTQAIDFFQKGSAALAITDLKMPGMDGLEVIRQIKRLDPDAEIIVLTAFATIENAIQALKENGAYDFLTKPLEDIDQLLLSVDRAIEKRRLTLDNQSLLEELRKANAELEKKNQSLEAALGEVKILKGLIPMCAQCKKIRDDDGFWQGVETYLSTHTDASFSHGLCPDCLRELYPDIYDKVIAKMGNTE